ncbi:MAG: putative glycosyltransferase [Naasia sp.]|nr:putative glycosyltransferase [Naasia sp.]
MSGIVILTLDGGGCVPAALALGAELQRRGHRVRFLAAPAQQERIRAADFDVTPYRHAKNWSPWHGITPIRDALALAALLGDRGYARDLADAARA